MPLARARRRTRLVEAERRAGIDEAKRKPPSARYLAGLAAAIGALIVVPYREELWRCERGRRG